MDYHNIFENIDIALSLDDEHRQLGLEDWKLPAFQHDISGKQCELHAAHFDSYEISPACCMSVSLNTLGMLSSSEDEGVTMPFSSPNLQSEPVRIGQMDDPQFQASLASGHLSHDGTDARQLGRGTRLKLASEEIPLSVEPFFVDINMYQDRISEEMLVIRPSDITGNPDQVQMSSASDTLTMDLLSQATKETSTDKSPEILSPERVLGDAKCTITLGNATCIRTSGRVFEKREDCLYDHTALFDATNSAKSGGMTKNVLYSFVQEDSDLVTAIYFDDQELAPAEKENVFEVFSRQFFVSSGLSMTPNAEVSDAHLGITDVEVAQKTTSWRITHPGKNLSDSFLSKFSGKLDSCGKSLPDYRCYILGCEKRTKRRDHMADHIRAHIGEKPYSCSVCGLSFIRSNDCQRHEANHLPHKKFICECSAGFSRRDLYVRHRRTACMFLSRCETQKSRNHHKIGIGRRRRRVSLAAPYDGRRGSWRVATQNENADPLSQCQ